MTPRRRAPRPHTAGFTLVEVLVAMLVMAVMAGMAWQGVDGITRARAASQQRLEQTLRLSTVVAQWDQDLASVQESRVVPQALVCDGANVRLTRRAPGGMQVITWSLRPEDGSAVWTRWASPVATTSGELQESWLRSLQLLGNEPQQLRALTGVTQWQVYFFRGNSWSNCQSSGQALPTGVRMVLTFGPDAGLTGSLTRDTLMGP